MGVDPVVEEQYDPNSYGFRVGRSPGDAITRIRTLLDKNRSLQWILDADVAKCFDTISHTFLMEKTPICDKIVVEQWLKCVVLEGRWLEKTTEGTPQGGIIKNQPVLCNIALNGLELAAKNSSRSKTKLHLTRYADDFVIAKPFWRSV